MGACRCKAAAVLSTFTAIRVSSTRGSAASIADAHRPTSPARRTRARPGNRKSAALDGVP